MVGVQNSGKRDPYGAPRNSIMKLRYLLLGAAILIFSIDRAVPQLADRDVRSSGMLEEKASEILPILDGLRRGSGKICEVRNVYALYAYQICFVPYTYGENRNEDGYYLVYHKPKPKLTIIMPANHSDDYYFQESAQGQKILFVRRDGTVQQMPGPSDAEHQ